MKPGEVRLLYPAHDCCCGIIFTKNPECYSTLGVASGVLGWDNGCFLQGTTVQNDWAAASSTDLWGSAFRNASPFQGLDLDTLEGFNFHKVLNTHALKNRALETCPVQSLAWCLFQSVMLKKVSQMWPKTKAIKEAFSLSSPSHLSVLNPSPPLLLTLLEHCRILMQLDLRCK